MCSKLRVGPFCVLVCFFGLGLFAANVHEFLGLWGIFAGGS